LPQPKQFLPILREFLKLAEDDGGAHVTCSVVSLGDNVAVDLLDGFATLGRWQDATVLTDRADIERTILRDLLPACDVNLPVFIHCTVETRAGYQGRLLLVRPCHCDDLMLIGGLGWDGADGWRSCFQDGVDGSPGSVPASLAQCPTQSESS
jgi:hypothetical protein